MRSGASSVHVMPPARSEYAHRARCHPTLSIELRRGSERQGLARREAAIVGDQAPYVLGAQGQRAPELLRQGKGLIEARRYAVAACHVGGSHSRGSIITAQRQERSDGHAAALLQGDGREPQRARLRVQRRHHRRVDGDAFARSHLGGAWCQRQWRGGCNKGVWRAFMPHFMLSLALAHATPILLARVHIICNTEFHPSTSCVSPNKSTRTASKCMYNAGSHTPSVAIR